MTYSSVTVVGLDTVLSRLDWEFIEILEGIRGGLVRVKGFLAATFYVEKTPRASPSRVELTAMGVQLLNQLKAYADDTRRVLES